MKEKLITQVGQFVINRTITKWLTELNKLTILLNEYFAYYFIQLL